MTAYIGTNIDDEKIYVVVLKSMEDAESFYEDMETPGGSLYIPNRAVECVDRRPISRCTNYRLTHSEAEQVKNDPRVESVTIYYKEIGAEKKSFSFEQTSTNFSKSTSDANVDINWGLLRCLRDNNIPKWGYGTGNTVSQSATIRSDLSGRNVDVIIADDGCPYPTVFEYSQYSDGSGYCRMVEYNWLQHSPEVTGNSASHYDYVARRVHEHGAHTTGTVAGNTQGWARDSTIFNLSYSDDNFLDYIKCFHKYKPVNPLTGIKNPTIVNNSWGFNLNGYFVTTGRLRQIVNRGTVYLPTGGSAPYNWTWNTSTLNNTRVRTGTDIPLVDTPTDADLIDLMKMGVIVVASAGNQHCFMDKIGGIDYDNWIALELPEFGGTFLFYCHRGGSPQCASDGTEKNSVICVGATGQMQGINDAIQTLDYKASYSNYGPRVDVYAPGTSIQSIWQYPVLYYNFGITDPRANNFLSNPYLSNTIINNFGKVAGTSMAGPQVTGILACLAEREPTMDQAWARRYLQTTSKSSILTTNGGQTDTRDAGVSYNANSTIRHVYLNGTRLNTNTNAIFSMPWPRNLANIRPTSGVTYPRTKRVQRENQTAKFNLSVDLPNVFRNNICTVTLSTTNVPDGTEVQYLITGKPIVANVTTRTPLRNDPRSGVHNATNGGPNEIFQLNTAPNVRTIFSVLDYTHIDPIYNPQPGQFVYTLSEYSSILGTRPPEYVLNNYDPPNNGDEGYIAVTLPGNWDFFGANYPVIYMHTNSYATVDSPRMAFQDFSNTVLGVPCVYVEPGDNYRANIYTYTENVGGVDYCTIWYEGYEFGGSRFIEWKMQWSSDQPENMVVHVGRNDFYQFSSSTTSVVSDLNSFSKLNNFTVYNYSNPFGDPMDNDRKVGNLTINNNQAFLPLYISTDEGMDLNVRLNMYPSPNVNIAVNY